MRCRLTLAPNWVKTQIRWWIDGHRSRLTPEQVAVLEENIDFVGAELYERPRSTGIDARKRELIANAKGKTIDVISPRRMV